ncbi:MAG: DUF3563 family protein [Ahrensia sp.]
MTLRSKLAIVLGAFSAPDRASREIDYLNRSQSLVDLERRQREIDRGKFRQF